jgi:hypothetical protein
MGRAKHDAMEHEEKTRNCPECMGFQTLWVEWGKDPNASCSNKADDCHFVGNVKDCENHCGNVLSVHTNDYLCYDCEMSRNEYIDSL